MRRICDKTDLILHDNVKQISSLHTFCEKWIFIDNRLCLNRSSFLICLLMSSFAFLFDRIVFRMLVGSVWHIAQSGTTRLWGVSKLLRSSSCDSRRVGLLALLTCISTCSFLFISSSMLLVSILCGHHRLRHGSKLDSLRSIQKKCDRVWLVSHAVVNLVLTFFVGTSPATYQVILSSEIMVLLISPKGKPFCGMVKHPFFLLAYQISPRMRRQIKKYEEARTHPF